MLLKAPNQTVILKMMMGSMKHLQKASKTDLWTFFMKKKTFGDDFTVKFESEFVVNCGAEVFVCLNSLYGLATDLQCRDGDLLLCHQVGLYCVKGA